MCQIVFFCFQNERVELAGQFGRFSPQTHQQPDRLDPLPQTLKVDVSLERVQNCDQTFLRWCLCSGLVFPPCCRGDSEHTHTSPVLCCWFYVFFFPSTMYVMRVWSVPSLINDSYPHPVDLFTFMSQILTGTRAQYDLKKGQHIGEKVSINICVYEMTKTL